MKKNVTNSKLIAYSATAGAALAVIPNAFGTVIHNGSVDLSFGNKPDVYLTIQGSNPEFRLRGYTTFIGMFSDGADSGKVFAEYTSTSYSNHFVRVVPEGQSVKPGSNYPNYSGGFFYNGLYSFGLWTQDDQTSFCGVSFNIEGGSKVYGWIQVERVTAGSGKIIAWAYEDDGTGIQAGAVPEPATGLALLALGAAGIARYRRSR